MIIKRNFIQGRYGPLGSTTQNLLYTKPTLHAMFYRKKRNIRKCTTEGLKVRAGGWDEYNFLKCKWKKKPRNRFFEGLSSHGRLGGQTDGLLKVGMLYTSPTENWIVTYKVVKALFNRFLANATSLELLKEQHFPAKPRSRHRTPA